jgi:hypothetical protein
VIATGFGPPATTQTTTRPASTTPVDMSIYAEHAKVRAEAPAAVAASAAAAAAMSAQRLSLARRPALDLSAVKAAAGPAAAARGAAEGEPDAEPELELGSAFDVPAFLRRQEG